jgi:hypothetical protein
MNLGSFFFMLLCFTAAAVVVVLAVAWGVRYVKQSPKTGDPIAEQELDAVRARLTELEQHDGRMLEIEERLDFMERALSRTRDAAPAPAPLRNPADG